ncbi:hypothetical protein CISG_06099 [Coccidioides immitis RMSCC 3703]|uniref:Uncharacterized protein n=1 Tax=Coccidioides immitis RMSCC 3703 TaxID=454286 RepID=A0A0J8QYW9_COCIT|nr:hypothetical protein CISG_06099 [Coccidioides immitis RMSCC 3703]
MTRSRRLARRRPKSSKRKLARRFLWSLTRVSHFRKHPRVVLSSSAAGARSRSSILSKSGLGSLNQTRFRWFENCCSARTKTGNSTIEALCGRLFPT